MRKEYLGVNDIITDDGLHCVSSAWHKRVSDVMINLIMFH